MIAPDGWPTREEVARRLDIGVEGVRYHERAGRLRTLRDPRGRVRITPDDVEALTTDRGGDGADTAGSAAERPRDETPEERRERRADRAYARAHGIPLVQVPAHRLESERQERFTAEWKDEQRQWEAEQGQHRARRRAEEKERQEMLARTMDRSEAAEALGCSTFDLDSLGFVQPARGRYDRGDVGRMNDETCSARQAAKLGVPAKQLADLARAGMVRQSARGRYHREDVTVAGLAIDALARQLGSTAEAHELICDLVQDMPEALRGLLALTRRQRPGADA